MVRDVRLVLKLDFPIHEKKCCENFAKFLVHELEGKFPSHTTTNQNLIHKIIP